jgi:hypothetical protein
LTFNKLDCPDSPSGRDWTRDLSTSCCTPRVPATQRTGLTAPTINAAFGELERLSFVSEVTGRKRGRGYSYRRFVERLSAAGGV